MTNLVPYLLFPGTAADALEFYRRVFGGELVAHSYAEFGRDDGPADAVAHGMLRGTVTLFAADAGEGEAPFAMSGMLFSLLGAAEPATLREWFAQLGEGGEVLAPLEVREWGDVDGQVIDRFGVRWLIGFQD
ncbi:VOC family protein [Homoserinibacter sp. GY 40078]|uniref:VOC family protein n=1 Tax=Homoserinibacter sp. GY 40078 TaxID=2603275 RepID=UPI0011C87F57|nr:VOC family protein [Homoserinibacter sp. GY 40078]TXK17040.1 VOC family protein [Homoserinibacter sp. GY 40078]